VCVKLTTRLHLVPRSRMCEAIPPLPNTPSLCDAHLKLKEQIECLDETTGYAGGSIAFSRACLAGKTAVQDSRRRLPHCK